MDYFTKSAQETKSLGKKIGLNLAPGTTIALFGDLGGGKTTFLQGLAKGLGVKKRILSPTFIVSRDYPLPGSGRFYHFDWYRLENENQVRSLGITDLFDQDNIIAIEWADRAKNILPQKRIEVYFKQGEKDSERKITILEKA